MSAAVRARCIAAVSTITNAAATLAPQLYAMALLAPVEFGIFSAVYLSFALLAAFSLSLVCDPWVILQRSEGRSPDADMKTYASLSILCLGFSIAPLILVNWLVTQSWTLSLIGTLASFVAGYRMNARFLLVYRRKFLNAAGSDLLALCAFLVGAAVVWHSWEAVAEAVLLIWTLSSFAGAILLHSPSFRLASAARWFRVSIKTIRPLMRDAVLMEAAYVGPPYALLPVLGLPMFGLYRAVSNTSAPVRMVLSPIRPLILHRPAAVCTLPRIALATVFGAVAGSAVAMLLAVISALGFDFGVFGELGPLAAAAGVFVFGTTLITIYAIAARSFQRPRVLLAGRLVQIAFGFGFPFGGLVLWGPIAAVWGLALSALGSGVVWLCCAIVAKRGDDRAGEHEQPQE